MKKLTMLLVMLVGTAAFAALAANAEKEEPAVMTAKRVETGPGLDADSEVWEQAEAFSIAAKGGYLGTTEVHLRAVHDGEYIYFRARWADPTKSINRNWIWGEDGWESYFGNEDRIALQFNINSPKFVAEGCDGVCHVDTKYTEGPGKSVDLWHWKAARGGPHGFCDDQVIVSLEDAGDNKQKDRASGRMNDSGRAGYAANRAEGGGPARVWAEDADRDGPFNAETSRPIPDGFTPEEGYLVPREMLREAQGSRSDIQSSGKWEDGHWTVVMRRKLNTGNADDAKFVPGERIHFAVALFDDSGADAGNEHSKSPVAILQLGG
jgi:hypothetical protein